MVEERITDGKRIAQLLSSELDGREDGGLAPVAVTNANRDVEPTADGARAYDVVLVGFVGSVGSVGSNDGDTGDEVDVARVFVHEDRARIEFIEGQDVAADAAADVDLGVRPKAAQPPRTLVFVESGAAAKRATDVVQAVVRAVTADE